MDRKTRGTIEEALDKALEQDFVETISWILGEDFSVSSPEDLALGYFLGSLMRYARITLTLEKMRKGQKTARITKKETNQLRDMLIQRIPSYRRKIVRELHR